MEKDVKEKVKQFIKNKDICVLATCSGNVPRASTVNYVADGFILYVITASKSTKVKNIKVNPNISVAIDDQGRTEHACLQAEAIAEVLGGDEAEKAKEHYSQKRNISKHSPELVDEVIKIRLKKLMFTDYTEKGMVVHRFEV